MLRITSSMLLLFAAAAWSSDSTADNPDGVLLGTSYGSIPAEELADPNDPTYVGGRQSPLQGILPPVRETEYAGIPWEGQDWGYDYFVYDSPQGVGSSQDFDVDPSTGYLYAAFDTYHTSADTIYVYRSTDNGATWSYWGFSHNPDGGMDFAKIRVATTGGVTYINCMCRFNETSGDVLWLRRWNANGSSSSWEQIAADASYADMDADIGSSAYLYATWVPAGSDDVFFARNAMNGAGWVNSGGLFATTQTPPHPAIAAGSGGVVSVCFIDTRMSANEEVRIKRSTDHGATWLASAQVSDNTANADLSRCDIAHARGPVAWITVTFDLSSGDQNSGYYYSTNTGSTWAWGNAFIGAGDEYRATIRADKGVGHVSVAYNTDPGYKVYACYASTSLPHDFSYPIQVNDQAAVIWGPATCWNDAGFPSVLYTRTDYSLWFDTFDSVGIEDGPAAGFSGLGIAPNPFMDLATISFTLETGSPVHVDVFDMSGRLVHTLADGASMASGSHQLTWDGRDASGMPVPGGVYVCRMTMPGLSESLRMVLVR